MIQSASISKDGVYRYDLTREWGEGPMVAWVMFNPSTADASQDDPTIRRCISFSQGWGFGKLVVVNLYALRATDPKKVLGHQNPLGPENVTTVRSWLQQASLVVCAWGAHRLHWTCPPVTDWCYGVGPARYCLGTTKSGEPRHPLYVKGDTPLQRFGIHQRPLLSS